MTWELYEVWTEDENGHQELLETTKSFKEAQNFAEQALVDGSYMSIIYKETENGDIEELERLTLG